MSAESASHRRRLLDDGLQDLVQSNRERAIEAIVDRAPQARAASSLLAGEAGPLGGGLALRSSDLGQDLGSRSP
jgi:hypothetical protein